MNMAVKVGSSKKLNMDEFTIYGKSSKSKVLSKQQEDIFVLVLSIKGTSKNSDISAITVS